MSAISSALAEALRLHGGNLPTESVGSNAPLELFKIAVFCSRRCPAQRMILALDWARALPERGTALVGGFHSPMEQECLAVALRRKLPVIACVARGLPTMRLPSAWKHAIDAGTMLVISTFSASAGRLTAERSHERNRFAALLADEIFIIHADSGSHTESLAQYAREKGKPLVPR
ncbi:MAG: DNA-processing protein DprA [Betaproteobacteria bacterium]